MEYWIIAYLIINSLCLAVTMTDRFVETHETLKIWIVMMLFGIPLFIYYSVPKWNWFLDNVWFWITLWFTDEYKDLDPRVIKILREHNPNKPQFKAMCKKYGY